VTVVGGPAEPLRAERFLAEAEALMAPYRGTYIHAAAMRGFREKVGLEEAGYGPWLDALTRHVDATYGIAGGRILDFGAGTGELAVRMQRLGWDVTGVDLHAEHLRLARTLALENGLPAAMFVEGQAGRLPFEDDAFGLATTFSVLEHLDDDVLKWLLPELRRVARVVFVLVPNRLKWVDDHTGLRLIPWLPRRLAAAWVHFRGRHRRYHISRDGSWDVHFRWFGRIRRQFDEAGFDLHFPPDPLVYPPLDACPPIEKVGKTVTMGGRHWTIGTGWPIRRKLRQGHPPQAFFPYLNLLFVRR
jgi:SAM-dependent methyltransferase